MAKIALCIGINNYPGTQNDLAGCVNDANDWAAELQKRGFEVANLLDQQATRSAITTGMQGLVERAHNGDVAVITYSGHGTWVPDVNGDEPDKRDEALCPYDLASGPLVDDTLYDIFSARHRGARVVFISDSCHSGTVSKYFIASGEKRRIRFLPPSYYEKSEAKLRELRRLERVPSRGASRGTALLMAGCQDWEYSYDAEFQGRPNGAFTRVALDALKGLAANATYRDWYAAIHQQLPSSAYPQTPRIVGTTAQRKWPVLG